MKDSRVVAREPCPECGSKDNLVRYSDGHAHCYGATCDYWEPAQGDEGAFQRKMETKKVEGLLSGQVPKGGLTKRKISEKTCQRYSYLIGEDKFGEPVQIAQFRDASGMIVGQKLRYADKRGFPWTGSAQSAVLFGQHLQGSGKRLFVTEGEIDCMSLAEMLDNRWPVVSIINGAPNAKKDLLKNLDYLKGFEAVVLVFDMDDAGRAAAEACAFALASTVPVYIASYSLKDPNDMLVEGRVEELVQAIWRAPKWRPKTIITLDEIWGSLLEDPVPGTPWPWEILTKATFGRRPGQLFAFSSGVGCGKTDVCHTWEAYDLATLGVPVAAFHFEEDEREAALRILSKIAGVPLFLPDLVSKEERRKILDDIENKYHVKKRLFLYGKWGFNDWETTRDTLRYLHHAEGVIHFYLDHLTALQCKAEDERRFLDSTMEEMASVTKELGLIGHFISHLRTPKGKPHEEGGRVTANQFIGSRSIMQWAHFMFAVERHTQHPDPKKRIISKFRVLKDRFTGRSNGLTFHLKYDQKTMLQTPTDETVTFEDESNNREDDDADF